MSVPVTIHRSERRRTVTLRVTSAGVTLHAPPGVPEAELLRFLERKRTWVEKHLQAFAQRRTTYHFVEAERFPLMDETLTLRLWAGADGPLRVEDELWVPRTGVRRAVETFYRRTALEELEPLAHEYAWHLGRPLAAVKLTDARTRWGSCTAKGVLRFNWRILLGPRGVVEYLVAHEAAHLREMNHGPRFWSTVAVLCPDFAHWQAVLRDEGHRYTLGDER